MGDPIRVVMLKAVAEEIRHKNLLSQCQESGRVLLAGLHELEVTTFCQPVSVKHLPPYSNRFITPPKCTVPGAREHSVLSTAPQSNKGILCYQNLEIKVHTSFFSTLRGIVCCWYFHIQGSMLVELVLNQSGSVLRSFLNLGTLPSFSRLWRTLLKKSIINFYCIMYYCQHHCWVYVNSK